jgi:two-component system, OmpR family, sensor kinase
MWRSLRFRLPALFLAGILLSGLVASALAFRLFQQFQVEQARSELSREGAGITELYENQARRVSDEGRRAPEFAAGNLERATGDLIYYVGLEVFPGQFSGLRTLSRDDFNGVDVDLPARYPTPWDAVQDGRRLNFEFSPPDRDKTYLGIAEPLSLGGKEVFGAIVVAKPKTQLSERLSALLWRLALAFLGGIVVAGALGWYLSRRITRPVLAVSKAADEVARGNYAVDVPDVPGGGEVSQLATRFRGMANRLREAEELERNFLMTVSHELRTPLTAIRGHVEALREGLVEDEQLEQESLDVVAAETARLERLVGDVLDLAKLDAHRFTVLHEEVDMGRLVDLAYSTYGEEARRRGIDFRQEVSDRPVILTDGDRVLQIISNLLANAFRWTPDGGRVEVALAQANGNVCVAVADSGPGIAPEERERIFRPFFTRDGGGTGLGLAIARELALALGGRIDLDTAPGRGSRFELLLPTRAQ